VLRRELLRPGGLRPVRCGPLRSEGLRSVRSGPLLRSEALRSGLLRSEGLRSGVLPSLRSGLLRSFDLLPEALPSAPPLPDLLCRELLRSGLLCGPGGLRSVRSEALRSGLLRSEALRSGLLRSEGLRSGVLRGCHLLPEALPSARSDLPAQVLLRFGLLRSQLVLRLGPGFRSDDGPGSGARPQGGPGAPGSAGPQGPGSAGPRGSGSQVDLSVPDWTGRSPGSRSLT
jgi:hypothetical protein